MRRALAPLALAVACGCGDNLEPPVVETPDEVCPVAAPGQVRFDPAAEPCLDLDSYGFFADAAAQVPADGVIPYDINTPLFSDYATKHRFLYVPEGMTVPYAAEGPLALPVGSVVIKSFGFLADLRDPGSPERLVETRLLVHRESGWEGLVYRWDEAQTEARLAVAGGIVPVSWIHSDGSRRELEYIVPNTNQCKGCHTDGTGVELLGPRVRHLNRDFTYPDGSTENQLTHLASLGVLEGAPANPDTAPRAPVFDDPSTGTLEERARAWLDINCAHCHNPSGPARVSGLDLRFSQENPVSYGVCKTPVAAGAGSGGFQYNIVPGDPDQSILVFRIESTRPDVRMPEILRQTVHTESAAVIRDWISSLDGDCAPPQ